MHIPQPPCTIFTASGKALPCCSPVAHESKEAKFGPGPQSYSPHLKDPNLNAQGKDLAYLCKSFTFLNVLAVQPLTCPTNINVCDTFPKTHQHSHHCEAYFFTAQVLKRKGRWNWDVCPTHDPWELWNLPASNNISSIMHILNVLAHLHNNFPHWRDCSLNDNNLRLELPKCNC